MPKAQAAGLLFFQGSPAFAGSRHETGRKRKSAESYDSTLDPGALAGTRIPGPLIKSATRASIIHLGFLDLSQFNDVSTHDIQLFVLHQKADFAPVATSVQL